MSNQAKSMEQISMSRPARFEDWRGARQRRMLAESPAQPGNLARLQIDPPFTCRCLAMSRRRGTAYFLMNGDAVQRGAVQHCA